MDPTLAEIRLFAGNFAPLSWAYCNGALMSIAENTALFSLLGTTYGGDGQVTFALPDFRGRIPIGTGQGGGLSYYELGQVSGTETITLLTSNLPPHSHTSQVSATVNAGTGSGANAAGAYWGTANANVYNATSDATTLNPAAVQVTAICNSTGSNAPFDNRQPYLALNYIICVEGIYPSRN